MKRRAMAGVVVLAAITLAGTGGAAGTTGDTQQPSAKRERCGKYNSASVYPKARVTAIRGVDCDEALKVAKKYDHTGESSGPWECFLAHGGGRALFSCGYGGSSGDVRDFPHALVAKGVGKRGG